MNRFLIKHTLVKSVLLVLGSLTTGSAAFANNWVGTADYTVAPGAEGDESSVASFDTYDFGPGIGLVKADTTVGVGNTFSGYFQTVVTSHIFEGSAKNLNQLDISGGNDFVGTGDGFELTVRSFFTGKYTAVSSEALEFELTGGSAAIYFDSSPDYSFANDSGFADGAPILTGTINSGVGSIFSLSLLGVGYEQVELDFSGTFDNFDANVFEPDTINGADASFLVKVKTPLTNTPIIDQVLNGTNTVGGLSATNNTLFEIDGQLQLTSVPLPGAVWMFSAGMMGFFSVSRKRKIFNF